MKSVSGISLSWPFSLRDYLNKVILASVIYNCASPFFSLSFQRLTSTGLYLPYNTQLCFSCSLGFPFLGQPGLPSLGSLRLQGMGLFQLKSSEKWPSFLMGEKFLCVPVSPAKPLVLHWFWCEPCHFYLAFLPKPCSFLALHLIFSLVIFLLPS